MMKPTVETQRNASPADSNFLAVSTVLFAVIFAIFGGAEPDVNLNLGVMAASGILLIFVAMSKNISILFFELPIYVRVVIVAPFILPFLQIIPLPPEIWSVLPGQNLRLETLRLVGQHNAWQPLSLAPAETAYTAGMGLLFSVFLMALIAISYKNFKYAILAVISVSILGALIGALQFSGTFPSLNFYKNAHTNMLVGFFANKNHMALILAVTLIMSKMFFDPIKRKNGFFLYAVFAVFLVIAVVATNSRAGVGLMGIALLFVFSPALKSTSRNIAIISTVFLVITFYYMSSSPTYDIVYSRFSDVGEDVRWDFLVNSAQLVREFFLFGSGYGSFSTVYMTRETVEALSPVYTNHLHSDHLQLLMEGGLLGLLALVVLGFSIFKAWRLADRSGSFRQVAWIGLSTVILFGIHSIVDYPMRRPAALVYFCIGLACLFRMFLPSVESHSERLRSTQTA